MKKLTFIAATLFITAFATSCGDSQYDEVVDQEKINATKSSQGQTGGGDNGSGPG